MDRLEIKGEDAEITKQYAALKNELEISMKSVKDDMDVERIKRIVSEMENLCPVQESTDPCADNASAFTNTILPRAIMEREMYIQVTAYNKKNVLGKRGQRIPKISAAAIVLVVFLVGSSIAVIAALGVFQPIVQWANGQLIRISTGVDSSNTNTPELSTLLRQSDITQYGYEGIDEANAIVVLKPGYIPDGFTLNMIEQTISSRQADYTIDYVNGDESIVYNISIWPSGRAESEMRIEIKPDYSFEFDHNEIHYYVFQNINWFGAMWTHYNIDYNVAGFESEEEVIRFLKNLNF